MDESKFIEIKSSIVNKGIDIVKEEYHPLSFGSWFIILNGKPKTRLVFDGRDSSFNIYHFKKRGISVSSDEWEQVWFRNYNSENDLD
jgi:hypothetical protein